MMLTQELKNRLIEIDAMAIGLSLNTGFTHPRIRAIQPALKAVGPAYTVRIPGRDNSMLCYAIEKAPEGSIIVVDRGHDATFAALDSRLTLMAKHRGLSAIVLDGPATNQNDLLALELPIYCTGFSAAPCHCLGLSGEKDIPVECGGVIVKPGDILLCDADGVIVLPEDYESVLQKAEIEMFEKAQLIEKVVGGARYLKSEAVDIEGFLSANISELIEKIKLECSIK